MRLGARIVGINNRDLSTFTTNLDTTGRLLAQIPHDVVVVSESGIRHREDVEHLGAFGVDAILVETMNTIREAKAATQAAAKTSLPVLVSFVCDAKARLLSGESLSDAIGWIDLESHTLLTTGMYLPPGGTALAFAAVAAPEPSGSALQLAALAIGGLLARRRARRREAIC